jgi:hypothetical protein
VLGDADEKRLHARLRAKITRALQADQECLLHEVVHIGGTCSTQEPAHRR